MNRLQKKVKKGFSHIGGGGFGLLGWQMEYILIIRDNLKHQPL